MGVIMLLRKSFYLAILALLPLVILGGQPGQALAGTPAAKYIGVDAYSLPSWDQVNNPNSQYYVGPANSEKFFYNGEALPDSDTVNTSNGIPGCGATKSDGGYVYPPSTLCIITWNTASSIDGSDLQKFLSSTVNDPHQIVMAFCNEPEIHHGSDGCVCYPIMSPQRPCGDSAVFISQFEVESNYITTFEQKHNATNVHVAEVSWADYYTNGACSDFIVPPLYVDHYLVDVYEGRNGNPISQPENLGQDQAWNNWVGCTKGSGVSRGIAEFAINCGNEQKSLNGGAYEEAVAASFTEDDTYLKNNFPNLYVWNLWDTSPNCSLDNQPGDEPDSVTAWQNIAAGD